MGGTPVPPDGVGMTMLAAEKKTLSKKPLIANLPAAPSWIESLRLSGKKRFDEVGYPTDERLEAWRFTDLRGIAQIEWKPAVDDVGAAKVIFEQASFGPSAYEIVLSNGRIARTLTPPIHPPAGVTIQPLCDAVRGPLAETIRQYLGTIAKAESTPFVALNQAHLNGGVFIHVKAGITVEKPIHILIISTPDEVPALSHPRVLAVVEPGARCTIVKSFVGPSTGKYFTNVVSEIIVGEGAIVDHYKLNQESLDAQHISSIEVHLGKQSQFIDHNVTLGSAMTRNDIAVKLNGEAAYSVLNGLTIISGSQFVDNHTLLEHTYPNCPSYELYKHVLGGNARGVFKGKIFVHDVAQKTDAKQASKTLLLSDDAQMNSQPALEIYADDVKCTHGSTTGPVDEAMMFYLQTRGLNRQQAKQLLIYAFAADVTRRIKVEPVRARVESWMAAQQGLPQDFRIQELGSHDDDAVY